MNNVADWQSMGNAAQDFLSGKTGTIVKDLCHCMTVLGHAVLFDAFFSAEREGYFRIIGR